MCDAAITIVVVVAGQDMLLCLLVEATVEGGFMGDDCSKDEGERITLINSLFR